MTLDESPSTQQPSKDHNPSATLSSAYRPIYGNYSLHPERSPRTLGERSIEASTPQRNLCSLALFTASGQQTINQPALSPLCSLFSSRREPADGKKNNRSAAVPAGPINFLIELCIRQLYKSRGKSPRCRSRRSATFREYRCAIHGDSTPRARDHLHPQPL